MPWTRHPKKTQSDRQFYSGQDSKYMIRRRRDQSIESRRERVLESKERVIHQQGTSVMRSQSSASNIISMQSSFHRQQHVTGNRVSETCASIICYTVQDTQKQTVFKCVIKGYTSNMLLYSRRGNCMNFCVSTPNTEMPNHKKYKEYFKVNVNLHNNLHKALNDGTMTIKQVMAIGISRAWAYIIKKHPAYQARPWQGRRHVELRRQMVKYIRPLIRENCFITIRELHEKVVKNFQITRGRRFINRLLKSIGYYSRIAVVKPPLTVAHKRARRAYAKQFLDDIEKQKMIVFSDESLYQQRPNRKVRVIRRNGTRHQLKHYDRHMRQGGHKVMLFGLISHEKKGKVTVVEGNINAKKYCQILEKFVKPFIDSHSDPSKIIFYQDNAPAHRAKMTQNLLSRLGIQYCKVPPKSCDINIIEPVWQYIDDRVPSACRTCHQTFVDSLYKGFDDIPKEMIQRLWENYNERMKEVLKRGGEITSK
ncbi:DDE_superfamily endonuclease domain containing protein [Hexamita inflata]|uniref:DDE superfamily endonuclease domain containing protein n=1 Tax=Hexamita inflata TaxID=28002 RepID=A0AA86NSN3_9EUKA|nr:DDE superfamily endonuclease domain containing protein [Hexamita inflata]CAI9924944.1 DDE superfamily endonuclease domain containing protein [Hexamita inflata]